MIETFRGDVLTKDEMKMRGIRLITTERGGIELRTQESLATIATWLIDAGFIEEYHYTDATIFMDLRRAYEASMGIRWRELAPTSESMILIAGQATEYYDNIRHQMGIRSAAKIVPVIISAMMDAYMRMPAEACNAYRLAFVRLSDAMQEVKKNRKNALA